MILPYNDSATQDLGKIILYLHILVVSNLARTAPQIVAGSVRSEQSRKGSNSKTENTKTNYPTHSASLESIALSFSGLLVGGLQAVPVQR